MSTPIKMTVVEPRIRPSELSLRVRVEDGAPWEFRSISGLLTSAGYKPGDEVELVPAGRVAELETLISQAVRRISRLGLDGDLKWLMEAQATLANGGAE